MLTPLQEKVIIGVAYDCVEKMVYWTEITSPSISKANIHGGEPVFVITSGILTAHFSPPTILLLFFSAVIVKQRNSCLKCGLSTDLDSPEGIAIDHLGRTLFWTDSVMDRIEVASLDGSQRRVIVDSDLVNPRAIITDPPNGCVPFQPFNALSYIFFTVHVEVIVKGSLNGRMRPLFSKWPVHI